MKNKVLLLIILLLFPNIAFASGIAVYDKLEQLNDVNISSPSNGQALIYNSSTGKWENKNSSGASLGDTVIVDGTTYSQDESGIESAISDAGENGVVMLTPGTYDIDGDGVSIWTNGITIVGDRGAILRLSDNNASHNIFNIGADYVTLKGFTIDGNRTNQSTTTYYGIKVLDGADYFTADGLYVKDTYDRGINIQGNNFQIINCRFEGCGQGYSTSYTGAVVFQDAEKGVIANNEISNSPSGIVGLGDSQGITITGNCISNITCDQAAGIYCNDVDGLTITGNALYDFSTTEHGVNGIFVAENDNEHLKTTISGNYLYGITGVGIELQSGWCVVSNNIIRLTNGGAGTSSDQHGIYIASGTENIVVEGNFIYYSHRDGINIGYNAGDVHDLVIKDNVIDYSTESGINFDFSSGTISRVLIAGNFIKNNSDYGIEKTNSGTLSDIVVKDNVFNNNTNGNYDSDIESYVETGEGTLTITSSTDGKPNVVIKNTTSDLTTNTTLLSLEFDDYEDQNQYYLRCLDSNAGMERFSIRNNGAYCGDRFAFGMGNSQDARLFWDTTGNDHLVIGVQTGSATQSGIVAIQQAYDAINVSDYSSHPKLRVYNEDETDSTKYLELYHDGTNGIISCGKGNIKVNNPVIGTTVGQIYIASMTYTSSTSVTVGAGSYGDCNGHYWEITSNTIVSISNPAGEDFYYLYIDDDASSYPTPSFYFSTTEPTHTADISAGKIGWYNGDDRCIGSVFVDSSNAITNFVAVCEGSTIGYYPSDQLCLGSGMNPNGSWQAPTTESSVYCPVNAIKLLVLTDEKDAGNTCSISVANYEQTQSYHTSLFFAQTYRIFGYDHVQYINEVPLGNSRNIRFAGEDNDDNTTGVYVCGWTYSLK